MHFIELAATIDTTDNKQMINLKIKELLIKIKNFKLN